MESRKKRTNFWIIGILTAIIFAPGVFGITAIAQEDVSEAIDIGKITVMAPQPGVEITTEKTIIRMDEFKKPGEVRTLTDVLTEIGGVDVQRVNPLMASPGDEVSIRGLNEGRLVIEIDGRRINHTGHYGRYIVDWSTLNMDDIDHIEIIRGGHSVLHPFAIGGVINIVTKKGKKTVDLKPAVDVRTAYGKYNTWNASASVKGGAGNFVGYNFSVSTQESDGYLRNNFQETDSFNGHLTFFLPGEASLTLGVKRSEVVYGDPVINDPARADYDDDYPKYYANRDQLRHIDWPQFAGTQTPKWEKDTTYLDAVLDVPIGPGIAKVHYFQTVGRRWTSMYDSRGVFRKDDFADDETQGVIVEYRDIDLFDSHSVTVGAEWQELGWPDENPIIYKVQSAYIQDIISVGDRWRFTPGVRYYHINMDTYFSNFAQGPFPANWPTAGKEQTESGFYPSLKIDFQATPETALYAAVSRSYRLPCP
ncbi:MAG: TonB-dependent receptor [Deltaproteobacteria bacterium]|nr:TonB-dependent receptor [Deltaproteobacteria bacterium]